MIPHFMRHGRFDTLQYFKCVSKNMRNTKSDHCGRFFVPYSLGARLRLLLSRERQRHALILGLKERDRERIGLSEFKCGAKFFLASKL